MELVCSELGKKIRSAIRVRLLELGKTVDDELVDYIMVMAANKKEESQMARDLQPFLEEDTVKFTSWLQKVLKKLEQITVTVTDNDYKVANLVKKPKAETSSSSSSSAPKKTKSPAKEDKKKKSSKKDSPDAVVKKAKTKVKSSTKASEVKSKIKVIKVKKGSKDESEDKEASTTVEKPAVEPPKAKQPVMMVGLNILKCDLC
jgi:hypothetical protein